MTNFIEIGGLIKKGLGHSVVERFSKNFSSMTFLSLIFANNSKKLCVKEEIDRQLKEFMAIYELKEVRLDGH